MEHNRQLVGHAEVICTLSYNTCKLAFSGCRSFRRYSPRVVTPINAVLRAVTGTVTRALELKSQSGIIPFMFLR